MVHCYDQRPIDEIRNELLYKPFDKDNLLSVCIVLCNRIEDLQFRIAKLEEDDEGPNPYILKGDELDKAEQHRLAGQA